MTIELGRSASYATRAAITLAALAATSALVAPTASAAPVDRGLALTAEQFPAGSTGYRIGAKTSTVVGLADGAPAACRAAADRVNAAMKSAEGVSASAQNGFSAMDSTVVSPAQSGLWRTMNQQCGGTATDLAAPADLAAVNPTVITYRKDGRTSGIEGVADVRGYTVNVYVGGMSATEASADKFWQVFRAQIKKVQAGR